MYIWLKLKLEIAYATYNRVCWSGGFLEHLKRKKVISSRPLKAYENEYNFH